MPARDLGFWHTSCRAHASWLDSFEGLSYRDKMDYFRGDLIYCIYQFKSRSRLLRHSMRMHFSSGSKN
ncbi:hypothetical protein BLAT2472_30505 [Burkholderia latens]